jgi:hypothetical protein
VGAELAPPDRAGIRKAADEVNKKVIDLEMTLIDLRLTGSQDGVRYAAKLISRLGYLANGLSNADFPPTSQQAEVQKLLAERMHDASASWDGLVKKDLAAFNEMLRSKNVPNVVVGTS